MASADVPTPQVQVLPGSPVHACTHSDVQPCPERSSFDPDRSPSMTAPYDQHDLQREWARDDRTILNLRELITTDGGFTFDPTRGTLIEIGSTAAYAIAVPGTEHVIGAG